MRAWALLAILCACGNAADHEGDEHEGHDHGEGEHEEHGHDHGDHLLNLTAYGDSLEFFAKHPPLVAGDDVILRAYITDLTRYDALSASDVVFSLGTVTTAEAQESRVEGLYAISFTAPAAGTYPGRVVIAGVDGERTIAGFELVVYESSDAADEAQTHEAAGTEPLAFTKERQWQVPFATAVAERSSVIPSIEVPGEITTPPSGQAEIGAAIAGRVVAPRSGLPRPGDLVRAGQVLATIAPAPASPESAARATLAVIEAEARVQTAQAAFERAERLIVDRAISQREVDESRREVSVAEASVRSARRARSVFSGAARGTGGGTYRVTSPIAGVVTDVTVTTGQTVSSGETMLRVVNLEELWVSARVPEQEASQLQSTEDAAFGLPGMDEWITLRVRGDDANASVVNIGQTVDRRSRTVDIIYAIREPDPRLRVGAAVRVAVPSGEAWNGVRVPRSAVLDDDGRALIYVQVGGDVFEERFVRVGARSGTHVGISEGIDEGDRVVTTGANVIRLASRTSAAPAHGHVH
ncbi:MAG: cobalt-zinc-cadmium efflux system membrane fusion protein [Polyangiales bacterium]|jgi:cobalt-zinc-cadmium efflux system membrane fusion protein